MDLTRVEELIALMQESGITELSLEIPDFKVSIRRGADGPEITDIVEMEEQAQSDETSDIQEETTEPIEENQGLPVVSPVVGVFHNGGMLDPRETVREGDRVREGQLMAAIEAMKVPNELRAPVSGLVTKLLVEDGSAVEYGQPLFLIEPEHSGEVSDGETPIGLA